MKLYVVIKQKTTNLIFFFFSWLSLISQNTSYSNISTARIKLSGEIIPVGVNFRCRITGVLGLLQSSDVFGSRNTTFRKLYLFPSTDEGREKAPTAVWAQKHQIIEQDQNPVILCRTYKISVSLEPIKKQHVTRKIFLLWRYINFFNMLQNSDMRVTMEGGSSSCLLKCSPYAVYWNGMQDLNLLLTRPK
jgi:hypothetical protein